MTVMVFWRMAVRPALILFRKFWVAAMKWAFGGLLVAALALAGCQAMQERAGGFGSAMRSGVGGLGTTVRGGAGRLASRFSGDSGVIKAAELPLAYRADPAIVETEVDLSVLASSALDNDRIYPGDLLDVTILTGAETGAVEPLHVNVAPSGEVKLPKVGVVSLFGLTLAEAEQRIREVSLEREIYRSPFVSVQMNGRKTDRIQVVGAVNEPGPYELPRAGSDLLAAISAAKGLSKDAGYSIEIRHPVDPSSAGAVQPAAFLGQGAEPIAGVAPPAEVVHVDLLQAMAGDPPDVRLRDGSVVVVKEYVPGKVFVSGLVNKAGEVELPRKTALRVSQALALAAGRKTQFADKVFLKREIPGREPLLVKVSLKEARQNVLADLVLMPGDLLVVQQTPTTIASDLLMNFFRIGLTVPGL